MDQVSRPFQIVLVLVLAFAGLWFMALRPKADGGGTAPPPPNDPAPGQVQAAAPPKSAIPGGLGSAVDKARAAKTQGDAAAAARSAQVDAHADAQNTTATPVQAPPAKLPTSAAKAKATLAPKGVQGVARAGTVAFGLVDVALKRTADAKGLTAAAREARPGFATPAKVRAALAKRHAVVLLFYSGVASDDRAVRGELAAVDRRGGRVQAWGVSVRGLPRFKNVLQGVQVLQSPTVVVLSHRTPYVFPGYTDHAEVDQATAVALRTKRG
ncbi:MAG: hypothetical protein QOE65_2042 [Solirubrobacteraceae bacterium]|jgi:hypothetical protein|nr:hypothetical protein [Solirubrobacteraceae bacterium]